LLRWGIVSAAFTVTLFVIGVQAGALGVAVSYAVAMIALVVPCFALALPLIGLRVVDAARAIARPLVIASAAGLAALVVGRALGEDANLPVLALQLAAGLVVYVGLSLIANRDQLSYAVAVVRPTRAR